MIRDMGTGGDWDDSRTTSVNLLALKAFLQRFPALTKRQLFLAGESYAGVYIPSLARAILEAQVSGDAILSQVAFKGFAVGDACVGTDVLCGDTFGTNLLRKISDVPHSCSA